MIWPEQILNLFGETFAVQGIFLLQILLGGQLFNSLVGPNGLLMSMTNYQAELVSIQLTALGGQVTILFLFLPALGPAGVAMARSIAIILRNVILTARVKHHLDVNTTIFSPHIWSRATSLWKI